MVYPSGSHYLPYSIRFSEFMPTCFTRKWTKYENIRRPPFSLDTKMAAGSYYARKEQREFNLHLVTMNIFSFLF